MDKIKIFATDVDGTLTNRPTPAMTIDKLGTSRVELADRRYLFETKKSYKLDRLSQKLHDEYLIAHSSVLMRSVSYMTEEEIRDIAAETAKEYAHEIYPYTKNLVEVAKKAGYFTIAISGSPSFLVEAFAKDLGFDKVIGHGWASDEDGKYHLVEPATYHNKHLLLQDFLDQNRHRFTMKNSIAAGDTIGDYSLLEMVDFPIAINPSAEFTQALYHMTVEGKKIPLIIKMRKDMTDAHYIDGWVSSKSEIFYCNSRALPNGKTGLAILDKY